MSGRTENTKVWLITFAMLATVSDSVAATSPQPIRAVWSGTQSCRGATVQQLDKAPDQDKIIASGTVELTSAGARYQIPHVPKVDRFVLTLILDDKSRGVTDNYLLISDQDLKAPFGALVVTEFPPANATPDAAFHSVDQLEHALARSAGSLLQRREVQDPRLGSGVEYVVPNRIGSMCFPTSTYQFVPDGMAVRTVGVSRFYLHQTKLIELAFIIEVPESIGAGDGFSYARAAMDEYVKGLVVL